MCGLIYNEDASTWKELVEANMARAGSNKGVMTVTAVSFWPDCFVDSEEIATSEEAAVAVAKAVGPAVVHLQAPTSAFSRPHPARAGHTRVWHNGILQPATIEALRASLGSDSSWDTELIAEVLERGFVSPEFSSLWNTEGAWACVAYHRNHLYAFRNPVAPLFMKGASLSSVKIDEDWKPLEPGEIYTLVRSSSEGSRVWVKIGLSFTCVYNPYGI